MILMQGKIMKMRIISWKIEQKINEAGYECACVGTDDQMKIYTTEKSNIEKINEFISEYFNLNKSGFSITCIGTLPRNDSGKILYFELDKN